jgi:hypothetical protein
MDKIKEIAEDYLRKASCDVEGYLYPSQINISKIELKNVFRLLAPFGKEINGEQNSATPIFQLNDFGRNFIALGGWSEKERIEKLAEERHKEIVELSKKNICYVKVGIVTTIIIGLAGYVVSILLHKGLL